MNSNQRPNARRPRSTRLIVNRMNAGSTTSRISPSMTNRSARSSTCPPLDSCSNYISGTNNEIEPHKRKGTGSGQFSQASLGTGPGSFARDPPGVQEEQQECEDRQTRAAQPHGQGTVFLCGLDVDASAIPAAPPNLHGRVERCLSPCTAGEPKAPR